MLIGTHLRILLKIKVIITTIICSYLSNMDTYTILKMEEFIKIFTHKIVCNSGIAVLKIIDDREENTKYENTLKQVKPLKINAISLVLILQGEIDITIDYKTYKVSANHIMDTGSKHIIENVKYYPGIFGYHILIDKSFCEEVLQEKRPLSLNFVLSKRSHPICQISDKQAFMLNQKIKVLKEDIERKDHFYYEDLIKNNLSMFMMEIANCAQLPKKENKPNFAKNRKDIIVTDFINHLNNGESRNLTIEKIANKLCITPQYLAQVLKEKTGRNTSQWITSTKITEAKILLRKPNLSIGEIADTLKFSDLSSFSKFFKKNCGMSPLQYKNKT